MNFFVIGWECWAFIRDMGTEGTEIGLVLRLVLYSPISSVMFSAVTEGLRFPMFAPAVRCLCLRS